MPATYRGQPAKDWPTVNRMSVASISDHDPLDQPLSGCSNDINGWRDFPASSLKLEPGNVRAPAEGRATEAAITTRTEWLLADTATTRTVRLTAWILTSAFFLLASLADAGAEDGVWQAEDNFLQVNVACSRVYVCVPGVDILHSPDTKVVTSSNKLVWGICSAGSGPADSCNVCLTNPPTSACEWHMEKR